MERTPQTFEEAVSRLEEIVQLLESGELPLDETVRLYEEGQRLIAFCQQKLADAERRIKIVTLNNGGELQVREFEGDLP
ncbi:MAG: exodeoxyribonuclease VII small subunit [Armatimonadota bacterium]|jgi:exodeoxyribonuclease VII small subunit|nr:exodeoxyribonuclease VII small subunit [Armatimonadota bacterium]MDT7972305.1 exodeoxyribonuclease VII small subunit [Armatimonadota bacterium]